MADSLSREERVAAGLKKLKKFQQRSAKKAANSQKNVSKDKPPMIAEEKLLNERTAIEEESFIDLLPSEEGAEKVNTSTRLPCHTSASQENLSSASTSNKSETNSIDSKEDRSTLSESVKSKSDLDLSSIKELSSTESLLQISQQINGLMSETHAFLNGTIDQDDNTSSTSPRVENQPLEIRNQQLASQVDQLQQSNDHLQFQLQEAKAKSTRLKTEFEQERKTWQEKSHREQVTLKDQLQVHIQTIGLLVAEKTELQSSLALSQQTAKQKSADVEELQGRLRGSRQRAIDLERELNTLTNSNKLLENTSKELTKEVEKLKEENFAINKNLEELKLQNSEISEKLNKKINELQKIESDLTKTQEELSLTKLYADQVAQGSSPDNSNHLEQLHLQNIELEKKVSLLKESFEEVTKEKEQMSKQYQEFVDELQQKVTSLRDELQSVVNEKEITLKEKNELAEKLENLKNQQDMSASNADNSEELKAQLTHLETRCAELEKEVKTQSWNNQQMYDINRDLTSQLRDFEYTFNKMQEQEIDKDRLLRTMESDKVAAKRAVAQNKKLKEQLEELQSGFITMSNAKLELTDKLQSEQHITKELGERLSQQEEELIELKEQLASKENELHTIELSNTKGVYQHNQIVDRMRHYEAQGQVAELLQQELAQAKERIDSLENQNKELRMSLARQAETTFMSEGSTEDKDNEKRKEMMASLSASVRQLEMERNQMMKQLDEQKSLRTKLEEQLTSKEDQLSREQNDEQKISKDEYEMLKTAMQQLEERFKRTMYQIAELSEEKQRLEHLVLQLQGETDTIGDYIALYQTQRGLMRKRASEKDQYISQLARDREDLKAKLGELQDLVKRLLDERRQYESQGAIPLEESDALFTLTRDKLARAQAENLHTHVNENNAPIETQSNVNGESTPESRGTAKKIMDLLTEIETTNLMDRPVIDTFHPCPVCSGRLITV